MALLRVMHIMCEVDPVIVQRFTSNIVEYFRTVAGVDGFRMRGGAQLEVAEVDVPAAEEKVIRALTKGLIGVREKEIRAQNTGIRTRQEARAIIEQAIRSNYGDDVNMDAVIKFLCAIDERGMRGGADLTNKEVECKGKMMAEISEFNGKDKKSEKAIDDKLKEIVKEDDVKKLTGAQKMFALMLGYFIGMIDKVVACTKAVSPNKDGANDDAATVSFDTARVLGNAAINVVAEENSDLNKVCTAYRDIAADIQKRIGAENEG
jgi:hypothetical protein